MSDKNQVICQRCSRSFEKYSVHNMKYRETFPIVEAQAYRSGVRISLETANKGSICKNCVDEFGKHVKTWWERGLNENIS